MADDLELNAGTGGATIRALEDVDNISWPVGVTGFATTIGTPDVGAIVTPTTGLPVRLADGAGYIATLPVSLASVPSHAVTNAGTFATQAAQSGTWTVDLGATDNAVLDAIAASVAGTLTVSGTVTANAGTGPFPVSDNAGSLTVDAPVGTPVFVRLSDGSAAIATLPVSLASVPSHAVTNAGTFVVQVDGSALASLQLLDDVVYVDNAAFSDDASKFALIGGVYQSAPQTVTDGRVAPILLDANGKVVVATHAVTQSGTWNVGTVTTVTGVTTVATVTNVATIGTSVTPGTAAAHLGKAEDAAHTSADTGVAVLAVRRDSAAVGSDSDGDYSTLNVDASGRLWCNVGNTITVASHAVTNAGTFVVQVDGAALTAIQLIDDIVYTDDTSTHATGTSKGALFMAAATPTDGSVNANDIGAVAMTTDRKLHVSVQDAIPAGTNNIGDVDILTIAAGDNNIGNVDVVTVPTDPFGANADAASATGSISAKLRFIAATGIPITGTVTVGSHAVTNAGTFAVQVDGSALTSLQLIDDAVFTDDAAFTPATSKGLAVGFQADETATDSVDEGDFAVPRITLDRKVIVTPQPHTAGGCSIFRSIDLDEGTLEVVKASAGQIYGGFVTNTATSTRWIKFYDATSGTAGTGTPVITIGIPGNATDDIGATFNNGGMGIAFATGICVGAVTGVADNDTGAPGANDVIINLWYK